MPTIARQVGVSVMQVSRDLQTVSDGLGLTSVKANPSMTTEERIIALATEHPDWEQRQIADNSMHVVHRCTRDDGVHIHLTMAL